METNPYSAPALPIEGTATPPQARRRAGHYLLIIIGGLYAAGGLFLLFGQLRIMVTYGPFILSSLVPGLFFACSGVAALYGWALRVPAPFSLFFGILALQPALPQPRSAPESTDPVFRAVFVGLGVFLVARSAVKLIRDRQLRRLAPTGKAAAA